VSKMAYRIGPSGATNLGPVFLYGYSFAADGDKAVKRITLPNNRNVVVLAVNVGAASVKGPTPIAVDLTSADDVMGIADTGSSVTDGGLDGEGNTYYANLTGASISWSGATFTLGTLADTIPPGIASVSWTQTDSKHRRIAPNRPGRVHRPLRNRCRGVEFADFRRLPQCDRRTDRESGPGALVFRSCGHHHGERRRPIFDHRVGDYSVSFSCSVESLLAGRAIARSKTSKEPSPLSFFGGSPSNASARGRNAWPSGLAKEEALKRMRACAHSHLRSTRPLSLSEKKPCRQLLASGNCRFGL